MVDLLLSWRRERDGMERRWQSVVKKVGSLAPWLLKASIKGGLTLTC